ncbi:hypothetical protein ORIO_02255 [Cereibacter azotoformans]|uniref:hypothetical protein n=1 Tax=Cereibacter azotoformans TaxID=43057 RepID=UPI0012663106|nr:hypothetical protein [Cereibacter azotoformans]ULB08759.1 hypothetical protein ORIO_02255 [Cereibacter azotoformans]
MRLFPIILAVLLAACGPDLPRGAAYVPPDLLTAPAGWTGPSPRDEGELIDAAAAEKRGREQCVGQLIAIAEIVQK